MLTVDEIMPVLGSQLDERVVESLFGTRGQMSSSELDPSHPDDQRHYYMLPEFGVQFLLGENEVVETIFFHINGDEDVGPYPWSFLNGLKSSSSRSAVLALFGTPERTGQASEDNQFAPGGWDRFRFPGGLVHFQYNPDGNGISMVTAMWPPAAPDGG